MKNFIINLIIGMILLLSLLSLLMLIPLEIKQLFGDNGVMIYYFLLLSLIIGLLINN